MLEFRALGPIEVVRDGQPVELGKGIERALLAILVLNAGRSVATDEIVDALWGERLPATAREMVRNYVGRLRRRLGPDVVATTPSGYRLVADVDSVDIAQFERLASDGAQALERGDARGASLRLRKALGLWRGRPLPELDESQAYAARVGALDELRLRVEEERVAAELSLGRARMMIPALEALVESHPYRERLLGQLMVALYRSGRQKDALDRYASARSRLVEEVGLEPGEELRELQARILRQDPTLNEAELAASPPASLPPARTRRRKLLLIVALIVAAALVLAAVLALRPTAGPVAVPVRGVVALTPASGKVIDASSLRVEPGPLAVGFPHVWVASGRGPSVFELGWSSGDEARAVPVPATPFSLAIAGGSLWVGDGFNGMVSRIDARGRLVATFRPQRNARGRLPLGADNGQLWVASQDGSLTRLDPTSGRPLQTYRHVGEAESIAVGDHAIWIASATADSVERFNPSTGRVVRIPVGGRPSAVVAGDGAIWALTPTNDRLWRIDPQRNAVTRSIALPSESTSLATAPGTVWVGSTGGFVATVDSATNKVVRTESLGRPVDDLASGDGRIWATVG
jgi:DNA-binding SARP family transcriptional activator/streptogramin lyase